MEWFFLLWIFWVNRFAKVKKREMTKFTKYGLLSFAFWIADFNPMV